MPLKPWQPCLLANAHVGSPQQPMSLVCAMNFIGVYKVVGVELCHVAVKFIPLPVGLNKPLHSPCGRKIMGLGFLCCLLSKSTRCVQPHRAAYDSNYFYFKLHVYDICRHGDTAALIELH